MPEHILDVIGDALPDLLPARGDSWVSVSWYTDDPAVLHRLCVQYPRGWFEPGEYISWRDEARRLCVQVSYISDDDDGGAAAAEPTPDPNLQECIDGTRGAW